MSKQFYCAECGAKLETTLKAIPQEGIVITVVRPHSCEETREEDKFSLIELEQEEKRVDKALRDVEEKPKLDFDFVKKLNKAVEVEPMTAGPGDLRPKTSKREELATSTAPLSVLNKAPREAGLTPPVREDMEEPEDERT